MDELWVVSHAERGTIGTFASARAAKREFNRVLLASPFLRAGLRIGRYRTLVFAPRG